MDDVGSIPTGGAGYRARKFRKRHAPPPWAYYWQEKRRTEQRRGLFHGIPDGDTNAPLDWVEQDVLPRGRRRPTTEWDDPTADEALRSLGYSSEVPDWYYEAAEAHATLLRSYGCQECWEGVHKMPFNMLVVKVTDRWQRLERDHLLQLLKRIRTEMQM